MYENILAVDSIEVIRFCPNLVSIWNGSTVHVSLFEHIFDNAAFFPNSFKSSVLLVGHSQTVQTQIRRCRTRRMIRVYIVCLQNVLLKSE